MPETSGGLDASGVAQLVQRLMPQAATSAPPPETTTGTAGTSGVYATGAHTHPRLTSTTMATVVTGSTVQVDFTYKQADGTLGFKNKPGMVMTEIEGDTSASSQPAIFKVQSWVRDVNGNYTGAVIKVWRSQTVPQNLATLLIGSVFNLFNSSVVGTVFSVIAVARSDV